MRLIAFFLAVSRGVLKLDKIGQNWTKLDKIGQNWTKIGQNWTKLDKNWTKIGQNWTKLDKNWTIMKNKHSLCLLCLKIILFDQLDKTTIYRLRLLFVIMET